ncbi:MAG: chromosomal replication initiator protein DnaA [Desulfuromonadia bacterium]
MEIIWQKVQANLETVLTPQSFTTWIRPIQYRQSNDTQIELSVPNRFILEWVSEKYIQLIQEAITTLAGNRYGIQFTIDEKGSQTTHTPEEKKAQEPNKKDKTGRNNAFTSNLYGKFTFDTFVSGSGNQFAYAASQAVANNPATSYNPLFIYGGVGLGKTHLLYAIGNQIIQNNREARIYYYTSETFMNEMINSIRNRKMEEFRNKFRKADVLLIDDIQFMVGKEATQEEFFHTFNTLYESHKQIVIASDKFPKEIPDIEERLRSRFEWGLIADIQPPDTETKVAILKKKAELNRINLPDDVAMFIATGATTNIRELEGILIRLGAYASLTGQEITLSMARENLKDIIIEKNRDITVESIQKIVAEHFRIKLSDLKSAKRIKNIIYPRQIAMFLCRELTKTSYPEIGERFGGKDHSTIIHSVKKIEKELETSAETRETVDFLRKKISQ